MEERRGRIERWKQATRKVYSQEAGDDENGIIRRTPRPCILTKRAVIYTRVSSQGQQDHGTSLGSQLDACKQYAAQHGFQIALHADEGAGDSGTQERIALQQALDIIKTHQADVPTP